MSTEAVGHSEPLLRTLAPALRGLHERLGAWLGQKHRIPLSTLNKANLEGMAGDLERQANVLEHEQPLLIIVLMGGTGVGKSTLLNALAGGSIASASFARPTTRDPVVYYHQSLQTGKLDQALQLCKLVAHDRPNLQHKIVVDTPDLDSNDLSNREKLKAVLPVADIVLYVGSQEKYHDKLGWDLFKEQRQRRAFAFVLNKWDRCQHPGAGVRPDQDLMRDLREEGFANPLLFRTCAQHWVDHPWQLGGSTNVPAPVEGEQFLELVRWLELGLDRLEIEAIKARGVGQLLAQLDRGLTQVMPPDLSANVNRVRLVWAGLLREEAQTSTDVLLTILDPFQKEIEHHFALRRQDQFTGIMGFYLGMFNKFRYAGSTLREQLPSITPRLTAKEEKNKPFDLDRFTEACSKAATEQHLDARFRALTNRLLVEADTLGMPIHVMTEPTEALAHLDWKGRNAEAMIDVIGHIEKAWTEPVGPRRWVQWTIVTLANVLPMLSIGGMAVILLWHYIMERRDFNPWDLLLPLAVVFFLILALHVVIALVLPLRWSAIRGQFDHQLRTRLQKDLEGFYLPVPSEVADALASERRGVENYLKELREVADWLRKREEAALVAQLYGKEED